MSAATASRIGPRRAAGGRRRWLEWTLAGGVAAVALGLAIDAGVVGVAAVPDVLRAAAATVVLFGVAGYAPTRLLAPKGFLAHFWLLVLPIGAATSGIALTILGFLQLPLELSLVVVLTVGAGAAGLVRVRRGAPDAPSDAVERAGPVRLRTLWPLYLAAIVVAVALIPVFRGGFVTVIGQNPDGHLSAGVADFLRHAPPTADRPELPVDRMPYVWRSKYPIYYPLAGVSELSGLETYEAFATVSAVMLGLTGLAFFLFCFYALHAGPIASLLALGLVPFDRVALHVTDHPFYNQLWGLFSLPLILLFAFVYLRRPGRATAALALLFLGLGATAYPLMLAFPAVAIAVAAWVVWRARRERGESPGWLTGLRLPRGRRWLALWIPLGLLLLPAGLSAGRGVAEKVVEAVPVLLPGGDLSAWRGGLVDYYPLARFFGLPGPEALGVMAGLAFLAMAWIGLRAAPREARLGLAVMAAGAVAAALYLRFRLYGEYFQFKLLAFLGPLAVACAVAGAWTVFERVGKPRLRIAAAGGLAALALIYPTQVAAELRDTYDQLTPDMLELRDLSARLPQGSSIRLHLPPDGVQLWAAYMLADHPLSAPDPIRNTTFPHVPEGWKADFLLAPASRRPSDAVGPPLFENGSFRLYRMAPGVPGPDRSSRRSIEELTGSPFD